MVRPEVVHRAMPPAEVRGISDGARHVVLGQRHGFRQRPATGQMRRQGSGKRAARSMGVRARDTRSAEFGKVPVLEQEIADLIVRKVPSLDQNGGCSQCNGLDNISSTPDPSVHQDRNTSGNTLSDRY